MKNITFTTEVWLYKGTSPWHFVSLPVADALCIKKEFAGLARGWGSVPVDAQIGKTKWQTSIFPDKKSGTYILPLRVDVRTKEEIRSGEHVRVTLRFARFPRTQK